MIIFTPYVTIFDALPALNSEPAIGTDFCFTQPKQMYRDHQNFKILHADHTPIIARSNRQLLVVQTMNEYHGIWNRILDCLLWSVDFDFAGTWMPDRPAGRRVTSHMISVKINYFLFNYILIVTSLSSHQRLAVVLLLRIWCRIPIGPNNRLISSIHLPRMQNDMPDRKGLFVYACCLCCGAGAEMEVNGSWYH